MWDVLGGHCEADETPAATLVRELREEIGVTARAFEQIAVLGEPDPAAHGEARELMWAPYAWTPFFASR